MTPLFKIAPQQLADLQAIRDLGPEKLHRVLLEIQAVSAAPLSPEEIHALIDRALGTSEAASDALLRQMLSLNAFAGQLDLHSDEVFSGLLAGLRSPKTKWTDQDVARWEAVADHVKRLADLEVIRLSAKALNLAYEHAQLFKRARIMTDIRPVFSDDADTMSGAVVSHTLLLHYDSAKEDRILSLALDETDIRSLQKQCDRALKKSNTARALLEGAVKISVLPKKAPGT